MVPFSIAGVQMHVPALHSNLDAVLHRLAIVATRFPWVNMVLFSELALCGPVHQQPVQLPGPEEAALQRAAAKHGVWLVPGSVFERSASGQIHNTSSVIAPDGTVVARYRKMVPFLPYEAGITAGTEFCVFDVPSIGRFGLSICYDMWLPETSRSLTALGAEVLLHPVLTGTIDRSVELAIAQATAAQFQCYVFDINGLGPGGFGRSLVVDPSGTVIHQAGGGDETIPVEIDLELVRRRRQRGIHGGLGQPLKSFRDRAFELPVYDRSSEATRYLDTLGGLEMPSKS
ncbi:MAG: carbon-nitrogen hydrolase family protein [Steroidobacteraceae bacterium]